MGQLGDRRSDLPDGILCHILSFLPFKDVVRTTVLSTRWKCLFASVPCLDVVYPSERGGEPASVAEAERFLSFMDRVVLSRNSCVESFRLVFWGQGVDTARFCSWISALSSRGILVLDLFMRSCDLPACMFTCKTLKVLKLDVYNFAMTVHSDVCLPNFKTLHLVSIAFPDDVSAQTLFSGCLVLKDLVMVNCDLIKISKFNIFNHTLKRLTMTDMTAPARYADLSEAYTHNYELGLHTPNLVYLNYDDNLARSYSFRNVESLEEAYICTKPHTDLAACHTMVLDFMEGISSVKLLNLAYHSVGLLGDCAKNMPIFQNLINLSIKASMYSELYLNDWEGIGNLLLNSPKLETLTIILHNSDRYYSIWRQDEAMRVCSFSCLKTINICDFACKAGQMEMVKYFLKNAGVLRNLNLYLVRCVRNED